MKRTLLLIIAPALLGYSMATAEWTKLGNFETDPESEGWHLTHARGDVGHMVHATDPLNANNKVLYVESGGYGVTDVNTTFASRTIDPINPGDTVTLYWRYYQEGASNSFHLALTPTAKRFDEAQQAYDEPSQWGNLETIYRIGQPADLDETSIRDSNRYPRLGVGDTPESFVPFVHEDGVWYEMWKVVRNTSTPLDDNYSLYLRGGEYTDITLLNVEQINYSVVELTGDYPTSAWFRNGTSQPLVTLSIITESGWVNEPYGGEVWYIDDVYMTSGEVLSTPDGVGETDPVPMWNGYAVLENNIVNTGDWMGLVTIYALDSNWAYSHRLSQWIYVGSSETDGGWLHIMR